MIPAKSVAAIPRLIRSSQRNPNDPPVTARRKKPRRGAEKRTTKNDKACIVVPAIAVDVGTPQESNMATRSTISLGGGANAAIHVAQRSLTVAR